MEEKQIEEVTIIYADTYTEDCWGSDIELFGIATEKSEVEKICNKVKEKGYLPQTNSIPINKYYRKFLGGYCE